jgi:hypothetical protein
MPRARYMALGGAMLVGCSLPPEDLCPCEKATCQIETNRCISLESVPVAVNRSVVYQEDRKLYCRNDPGPVYRQPKMSVETVDTMTTDYSWFQCWQIGVAPDKTIWFFTRGDENNNDGWMPADKLKVPPEFRANPSDFGFRNCSESP